MKKKRILMMTSLLTLALISCNSKSSDSTTERKTDGTVPVIETGSESVKASEETTTSSAIVNKSDLKAKIDYAQKNYPLSDEDKYEATSFTAYKNALQAAEDVLSSTSATQEDVDEALSNLTDALNNLKEVEYVSLKQALEADYSNNFIISAEYIEDSESIEQFTLHTANDFTIAYPANVTTPTFFHEYNGTSYVYMDKDANYADSKSGWLATGYRGQSLGLSAQYFDYSVAFKDVDSTKGSDSGDGTYMFPTDYNSEAEAIFFSNFDYEDEISQFYITVSGKYISSIVGVISSTQTSQTAVVLNFEYSEDYDYSSILPTAPNDNNIITWKDYKGEDPDLDIRIDTLTITDKNENQTHTLETEGKEYFYLEIAPSSNYKDYQSSYLDTVISDESIIEFNWESDDDATDNKKVFSVTGLKEGSATIYFTYQNHLLPSYAIDGTPIESNKLSFTVNGLKKDSYASETKTYDLSFTSVSGSKDTIDSTVTTVNSLNNGLPYTVTGHYVSLVDASNSANDFDSNLKIMSLEPGVQAQLNAEEGKNKTQLMFDFSDQQVSSFALDYGTIYSGDYANLSYVSAIEVLVRNDSNSAWSVDQDITSEIKTNISYRVLKHLEVNLTKKSNQVAIRISSSMIGRSFHLGFQGVRFYSDSECNKHIPTDEVLTGVSINDTYEVETGSSATVIPAISPNNATSVTFEYSSSDETIFTVSSQGVIQGIKAGEATLTVTAKQNDTEFKATAKVTVTDPVKVLESVSLPESMEITKGEENAVITPTFNPSDVDMSTLSLDYSSSDTTIATVTDSTATINSYKAGTCTITLKVTQTIKGKEDKVVTATMALTVKEPPLPTTIDDKYMGYFKGTVNDGDSAKCWLSKDSSGEISLKLIVNTTTYNATFSEATSQTSFTFYDDAYNDFTITLISENEIIISSSALSWTIGDNDSLLRSTYIEPTSIALNKTTLSLEEGGSEKLTVTFTPTNTTEKDITWKSSNTSVASVSDGTVKAVKEGSATITAITSNGLSATCTVTVTKKTTTTNVIPDELVGTYCSDACYAVDGGVYVEITLNADGSATMVTADDADSIDSGTTYNFTCTLDSSKGSYYWYILTDSNGDSFEIQVAADGSAISNVKDESSTFFYITGEFTKKN